MQLSETLPAAALVPWIPPGRCGSGGPAALRAGSQRSRGAPGWQVDPHGQAQMSGWWQAPWVDPHRHSVFHPAPGRCRLHPLCPCPRSRRCGGCQCCTWNTHCLVPKGRTVGHHGCPSHPQLPHQPEKQKVMQVREWVKIKYSLNGWLSVCVSVCVCLYVCYLALWDPHQLVLLLLDYLFQCSKPTIIHVVQVNGCWKHKEGMTEENKNISSVK